MMTFGIEDAPKFIAESALMRRDHWAEIGGKGEERIDQRAYLQAWLTGQLLIVGARSQGGELVGYFVSVVRPDTHNMDRLVAFEDSYYLQPEYRKGYNAMALIHETEKALRIAKVQELRMHVKPKNKVWAERLGFELESYFYTKELV